MKKIISFKGFMLSEAANIETFLAKIQNAQTESGLDELEKYYSKRKKEVEVGESDDITIRDAIAGRREEIKSEMQEDEVEEEQV